MTASQVELPNYIGLAARMAFRTNPQKPDEIDNKPFQLTYYVPVCDNFTDVQNNTYDSSGLIYFNGSQNYYF